jgi:hypothetical protein
MSERRDDNLPPRPDAPGAADAPDAIDRLNAWRDGIAGPDGSGSAPPVELAAKLDEVESQLKRAFDPSRAQRFAFADLKSIVAQEQLAERVEARQRETAEASEAASTTSMRIGPSRGATVLRWAGLAAACVAIAVTVAYVASVQWDARPGIASGGNADYPAASAKQIYAIAVERGMTPSWTCTAEELPARIAQHFASAATIAFAQLPANVELLGWSEPYYFGVQAVRRDDLFLMARVDGEPVVLVVAKAGDERPTLASTPSTQATAHEAQVGEYLLIEASTLGEAKLIPLVEAR